MVTDLEDRLAKYAAGIDPIAVYLKVKHYKFMPCSAITIQALKDAFFKLMMDKYELDARGKLLLGEAWKNLYYLGYNTLQVTKEVDP
jgi:hypothetical protein